MLLCGLLQRHRLFGREVRNNEATDATGRSFLAETLKAVRQDRIIVAHEEQRDSAL